MYIRSNSINVILMGDELIQRFYKKTNALANLATYWRDQIGRQPFAKENYKNECEIFLRSFAGLNRVSGYKIAEAHCELERVEELLNEWFSTIGVSRDKNEALNDLRGSIS